MCTVDSSPCWSASCPGQMGSKKSACGFANHSLIHPIHSISFQYISIPFNQPISNDYPIIFIHILSIHSSTYSTYGYMWSHSIKNRSNDTRYSMPYWLGESFVKNQREKTEAPHIVWVPGHNANNLEIQLQCNL